MRVDENQHGREETLDRLRIGITSELYPDYFDDGKAEITILYWSKMGSKTYRWECKLNVAMISRTLARVTKKARQRKIELSSGAGWLGRGRKGMVGTAVNASLKIAGTRLKDGERR